MFRFLIFLLIFLYFCFFRRFNSVVVFCLVWFVVFCEVVKVVKSLVVFVFFVCFVYLGLYEYNVNKIEVVFFLFCGDLDWMIFSYIGVGLIVLIMEWLLGCVVKIVRIVKVLFSMVIGCFLRSFMRGGIILVCIV